MGPLRAFTVYDQENLISLKSLTPFHKASYNQVIVYIGVRGYNFQKMYFFPLKIDFLLANSADPDEMLR